MSDDRAVLAGILTALGDDELILGHRHSEWTGFAPHIEEDVAFSSIAQDEIGHASAYYAIVGKLTGREPDEIALGREPSEYRNARLCERPNGDWAYTLARHWLYDTADDVRLESLAESSDTDIAALARKIRREERYHLLHADTWMKRIAHGPIEARSRVIESLRATFPDALGLFEPFENEDAALGPGFLPASSKDLEARYVDRVLQELDELGFPSPTSAGDEGARRAEFVPSSSGDLIQGDEGGPAAEAHRTALGGRSGARSEDFQELWDVMTRTVRAHPGASW